MITLMKNYTVKQLSEIAKVTIKTLHHYDEIGLLKPTKRTDAGYRLYQHQDLLRLQQILIYKELEFSLADIKELLDDPEYDLPQALQDQKNTFIQQATHYQELVNTISKTLKTIEEDQQLVSDEDLYGGFTPEQAERYDREAQEKYGELYEISQKRVRQMTKGEWKQLGNEGEQVSQKMASLVTKHPQDDEVQEAIAAHYRWVSHFYPCDKTTYIGLANLYVNNPEFTAHYERYQKGLAEFLSQGMKYFAEKNLS